MFELALLILFLMAMQKIPVGRAHVHKIDPYDNGTKEKYKLDNGWKFLSLDDCMEYRELRKTGWKGDVEDFYAWKYDYIIDDIKDDDVL